MIISRIFSVFPGVGKSWLYEHQSEFNMTILDSDSSKFSWISPGLRNPHFPDNYLKHIKDSLGTANVILVSSHDTVRQALKDNKIRYDVVYPHICTKDEYMKRYEDRGDDDQFIKLLWLNWNDWIQEIQRDDYPIHHVLPGNLYLSDLFKRI